MEGFGDLALPPFALPDRGRYEPNATIFQKRKLEQFASSLTAHLPDRFYEIIDGLGRDQAKYLIQYCEMREDAIFLAETQRQQKIEVEIEARRQSAEMRRLLWAIPYALLVIGSVWYFLQPSHPAQNPSTVLPDSTISSVQAATPTPTAASAAFAADVKFSQQKAIQRYPQLAVAGSDFNKRFVSRYKEWQERHDSRLDRSDWPEMLADEVAGRPVTTAPR